MRYAGARCGDSRHRGRMPSTLWPVCHPDSPVTLHPLGDRRFLSVHDSCDVSVAFPDCTVPIALTRYSVVTLGMPLGIPLLVDNVRLPCHSFYVFLCPHVHGYHFSRALVLVFFTTSLYTCSLVHTRQHVKFCRTKVSLTDHQ